MYDNIEKFLRVNNYFNFEGPMLNYTGEKNVERDTNYIISKTINNFITIYKEFISKRGTFVIKYDHDLYSYLALRIIHTASVCMRRIFDIRILGELNAEEQKFFKDFKTISYRNAKKLKNCVLVTGFLLPCSSIAALAISPGIYVIFVIFLIVKYYTVAPVASTQVVPVHQIGLLPIVSSI